MTARPRPLFIQIAHNFPEHWKTEELSDKAFRHLVEAWCFCARNMTDGLLSAAQIRKLFTPKTIGELTKVEYLRITSSGGEMLGYLDHQESAAQIAERRKQRSEAGAKGGKAKANRVAGATPVASRLLKQTASKVVPEVEVEVEVEELLTTAVVKSVARDVDPKATRLPRDWQPNLRLIAWVQSDHPAVNGRVETEKFRDWWLASNDKTAMKRDWDAAFRTWIRRADNDRTTTRPPTGAAGPASTTDVKVNATLALAAQLRAAEQATDRREISA